MRIFIMVLGILILVIFIGAVAVAMYVKIVLPDVGPPENVVIKRTPERVARGKYIANSVAVCMDCHSQLFQPTYHRIRKPVSEPGIGKHL